MNPQSIQYFEMLTHSTSSKSRELSKALTNQKTQQLLSQVHHLFTDRNQSPKQNSQISPEQKNKLPFLKQRLKTVQPKMKELSLSHDSGSQQIQSEENLIQKYREEICKIREKRQQFERYLLQDQERLQKMKIETFIASCIRRQQDIKREVQYHQNRKKQRSERQSLELSERIKKKESILKRLQKLGQHKQERQSILASKSVPIIPKYRIMERAFLMRQIKEELQKKIAGKKLHEVRYKDYLKDQHTSRRPSVLKDRNKKRVKTETDEKKLDKKEQFQKRKAIFQLLQEKRKHTFLKVDKERAHLLEIEKDKTKNPQKYHFLKMKNLTEEQIFKEFQDFEMDFDSKNIGKQYLYESKLHLKKETSQSRIKTQKIDSIPSISKFVNGKIEKKEQNSFRQSQADNSEYNSQKGGSHSGKGVKMDSAKRHKEEIEKILRESQSKSKVIELLSQESSNNNKNISQLQKRLMKQTEYQQFLKVQKNLDSEYLNFLKAKIVALGLQKL